MNVLEHLDARLQEFAKVKICSGDLAATDTEQSLFGPLTEPINCAAIDE
jgi:hypothetical protein